MLYDFPLNAMRVRNACAINIHTHIHTHINDLQRFANRKKGKTSLKCKSVVHKRTPGIFCSFSAR